MKRSDLKDCPWNPRKISEKNKKALKNIIKKRGLVSAITWNEKTGHVVGGHRRLEILDSLEKGNDYYLDVCVISVDEKEEAAINVALNNQDAMGEFDFGSLKNLQKQFRLDPIEDFGFTPDMAEMQFPDFDFGRNEEEKDEERKALPQNSLDSIRNRKKEVREQNKKGLEEYGSYNGDSKGAVIIVFSCETQKRRFLEAKGIEPDARVVSAGDVIEDLGESNSDPE